MSHVEMPDGPEGCWNWTGHIMKNGYGQVRIASKSYVAHRAYYTLTVGDVPSELDLDHLCRNRRCVNPSHLEPVTRKENMRRSPILGDWRRSITHCKRGHEYTEANTYRGSSGTRSCRKCAADRIREIRQSKRRLQTQGV